MKHLDLFAGIGGFRLAIQILGKDKKFHTKCVGFSEIDNYATMTYKANYDTVSEVEMNDIVTFTDSTKKIESLDDFDLLTGGFPCQSFSMMGKQQGFGDIRGNVFFRILEIAKIKKPKFILLENVRNLRTHNNGETFDTVINSIKEAGYPYVYYDIFNTELFGLAQKRNRVYIFASSVKLPDGFDFKAKLVYDDFKKIEQSTSLLKQKNILDVLKENVDKKYYLSETLKPTILSNGSKGFLSKSDINQIIARPLTATMVKMHRACQDNYYSDEFIKHKDPLLYSKEYFSKEDLAKHNIRKITPEEAFALQGFNESFCVNAINAGLSNHQLYKQAGNAVSVNTVYAILHYLFISNNLLHDYVF